MQLIIVQAQGYHIKVKISSLKDTSVLLGHYIASSLYPDDTIRLDRHGMGEFHKDKKLPGGMYFILLPSKNHVDFLIDDAQAFSITADTSNFLKNVKFSGSRDNELLYDYQRFLNDLIERKKKIATAQPKDSAAKALTQLDKEMQSYVRKKLADNPGLFFSTFLKSLQEIEVPDFPRDVNGNILDSAFQWRYYRAHYFDNFDYTDSRLLRTPPYEEKIKFYIDKLVSQDPDSIIHELDMMLDKTLAQKEVFMYLVGIFYSQYAQSQIMGQDAIYVHLCEKYLLPYGTWISAKNKELIKEDISKKKPNLLRKTAPNLSLVEVSPDHFMIAKTDTALKSNPYVGNPLNIKDIQAKFLVLAFWEADCGHCKKEIPALHEVYQRIKDKGAKVVAIHMISSVEGKRKWVDFVNDNNMYDWINAWSPYNHDYKDLYNVYLTPMIYVLDENKTIVAKRIGVEQVEEVINFELKKNGKK